MEPGRGDDDIGVEFAARLQANAACGKALDLIGDDVRLARLDGAEEVGVGRETQPLVPRIVTRREMGGDVVVVAELRARLRDDPLLDRFRLPPRKIVQIKPEQHIVPARQAISEPHWQMLAQPFGDGVLGRARDDIRWRTLQHGHMRGGLGHGGNDRHRGGAAADDDHPLARVVEVLGPRLRVHDAAAKPVDAGERGRIAYRIIVIAGAAEHKIASETDRLMFAAALDLDRPQRVGRRPRRVLHPMLEANVAIDAVGRCGLADVSADRFTVGNGWHSIARAGTSSRTYTCRNRSGCRDSGTDPRCRR